MQIKAVCCLPSLTCSALGWEAQGLQPGCCCQKFSGEQEKVTTLKRAIADHSSFCSERMRTFLLSFYFPFLSEFFYSYSAWKHRLSLVLQTQRCWFKGLSWQSLLPGVDLLISWMQGKRVELHNAVMQGEIPWWAFTSGLTLLLLCFKYIAFKEITPHFHWCKWGSDHIFCISISRYTNWKGLCVRWGDTVEESCFFCVF